MANFYSILLTLVTLAAGLIWLYDAKMKRPARVALIQQAEQEANKTLSAEERERLAPQGTIAEFAQSVFPILFVILILRSFLYEPFRIPSASMMPTMLAGDFVLVEKFSYGVRDPLFRSELFATGLPQRGDVAVFKYPVNPQVDFIKRIVALPGDRIIYRNKTLYIEPACETRNESCPPLQVIKQTIQPQDEIYFNRTTPLQRFTEQLGDVEHEILVDPSVASRAAFYYQQPGTAMDEWVVPEGHYFMMGDNRDNSEDSRYWGFVPYDHLVGRATLIWMSLEFERGADSWVPQWFPSWIPSGVRWHRLGTVE
ncbi:signal peptidase I . Serine peptidase. MEROPS family S26A [Pseudidiomarina indica]|uniref:Signal peptidase I n=1 Tax=Pseudidiomarina indica TaxID=1159017 RepID=A0A1G6ACL5_9GAMM|nr:signal peptidase I [Pseudidiomarina indica]SDB06161.1 signal peptidase I . Serine peptidase. MEROPS family S26A [Pseudidiomarina indica]